LPRRLSEVILSPLSVVYVTSGAESFAENRTKPAMATAATIAATAMLRQRCWRDGLEEVSCMMVKLGLDRVPIIELIAATCSSRATSFTRCADAGSNERRSGRFRIRVPGIDYLKN
jgi:hypothetical protein